MTPAEWHQSRIAWWTAARDREQRRAVTLSRLRLLTFFGAVALLWWSLASLRGPAASLGVIGGGVLFALFGVLVVRHARVLDEVARATAALELAAQGLARLARDWRALPEVAQPAGVNWDVHPYLRDLDLYGHASLATWLGATATPDGTRCLTAWLLTPASVADVQARQIAIDELADKREWREAFAVQGRLIGVDPAEVSSFLAWAEDVTPAFPRALVPVTIVLTLLTWGLFGVWLAGAIGRLPPLTQATLSLWFEDAGTRGYWWLPVIVNVVLSFVLGGRVQAALDRATLGQRALARYARMLGSVCDEAWRTPRLTVLQSMLRRGGSAPDLLRRLVRLTEWSELRTGAALLHLPIQAFTLWDFHVLFALERWRAATGRQVREWLDALGQVDALAVLSIIRADEPSWAVPLVDSAQPQLAAIGIGHPLMAGERRVGNDVTVGPAGTILCITGSNMSGKSTLLRSIGLNLVLAQAGAPVCAASFRTPPVRLHTSIHVEDSLALGLSYFMAALARLKQIVDAAERGRDDDRVLFYLLDEVLQGTNSVERGLAVRAVVRHLLDAGALGVMTTHDLALVEEEPLKSSARLAHFTEQVHADGRMTFDYRLRPGVATSTNALRLMQLIGIPAK